MVDLTKCQIRLVNFTNCKSQWSLSMVDLIKCWTSDLFYHMFGLSHGQKNHFSQMLQSKITRVFHPPSL